VSLDNIDKATLELILAPLMERLSSLHTQVDNLQKTLQTQETMLQDIRLTSVTRVAEMAGDIKRLQEEIPGIKKSINFVSQAVSAEEHERAATMVALEKVLNNEMDEFKETDHTKWIAQQEFNGMAKDLRNIMWAIFLAFLGIIVAFLWNGGISAFK